MENQKFMEEGIDGKRILLLLGRKIWVPIAAAFVGALLGGGVYLLAHLLFASQREYESVSKIYLTSAPRILTNLPIMDIRGTI